MISPGMHSGARKRKGEEVYVKISVAKSNNALFSVGQVINFNWTTENLQKMSAQKQ